MAKVQRNYELKKAIYVIKVNTCQAQAGLAYQLQTLIFQRSHQDYAGEHDQSKMKDLKVLNQVFYQMAFLDHPWVKLKVNRTHPHTQFPFIVLDLPSEQTAKDYLKYEEILQHGRLQLKTTAKLFEEYILCQKEKA